MSEIDSTNLPGFYSLAITPADLDYDAGIEGYVAVITESTYSILEYVGITPLRRSSHDDVLTDHVAASTFGELLKVVKGLAQGNQRLKNLVYDSEGRLSTVDLVVYPTGTDADSDTNAISTFSMTMTYDVDGNLDSLVSSE